MKARALLFIRYLVGGVGLYFALTQVHENIANSVALATLTAVGCVGVLSFASHVLVSKQDARQIGFGSKEASFQYEVGFANLSIGVAAIVSYSANWGIQANAVLLFIYALYLLQAGILHLYTAMNSKKMRAANLRRAIPTFIYSTVLFYIFHLVVLSGQL